MSERPDLRDGMDDEAILSALRDQIRDLLPDDTNVDVWVWDTDPETWEEWDLPVYVTASHDAFPRLFSDDNDATLDARAGESLVHQAAFAVRQLYGRI